MIYLISYELCIMPYFMSYAILSSYDLTALVYVLLLRLRLTISRLMSMHFVLCRFLRILEDMSLLIFLRILILLEEPPHLTADAPITLKKLNDLGPDAPCDIRFGVVGASGMATFVTNGCGCESAL